MAAVETMPQLLLKPNSRSADWAFKNEGPRGEAFKNVSVSGQR